MAKDQTFTYYNARNQRVQAPANAPIKLTEYRFKPAEWYGAGLVPETDSDDEAPTTRTSSGEIITQSKKWKDSGAGIEAILRVEDDQCFECGRWVENNHPACGAQCYRAWRGKTTIDRFIRIKEVGGGLGYGAFLGPRGSIVAHQTIGEYIGDIRPDIPEGNRYAYAFDNGVVIDSANAGNWTRFMNSHCHANVIAHAKVVGKRQLIMYQALRAIAAGEELTCNYGRQYFRNLGIQCQCDAIAGPHNAARIPNYRFVGAAKAPTGRRSGRRSAAKKTTAKTAGKNSGQRTPGATKDASQQTNATTTRSGRVVKPPQRL